MMKLRINPIVAEDLKNIKEYIAEDNEEMAVKIIADQLGVSEDEVTLEASFKEDLDADSLDLFELVMALEEEYDVEIPSDDLAELNTVGDVINYLKDKGVED